MIHRTLKAAIFAVGILAISSVSASAVTVRVDFAANGPVGFAPLFVAFHDGSFDTFDSGSAASAGLETLAEVGDPSGLIGTVGAGFTGGAVVGSPIVPPGTSATATFTVSASNGFFNYAAMVLPSNDWFVGNGAAADVSSFISQGIIGSQTSFNIGTVWDAGTELEDFAFSAGNPIGGITDPAGDAPNGTAQGGVISEVTGSDPFASFANAPGGFDSTALDFNAAGTIGTVTLTVVPEPTTGFLVGLAGFALAFQRRRK